MNVKGAVISKDLGICERIKGFEELKEWFIDYAEDYEKYHEENLEEFKEALKNAKNLREFENAFDKCEFMQIERDCERIDIKGLEYNNSYIVYKVLEYYNPDETNVIHIFLYVD